VTAQFLALGRMHHPKFGADLTCNAHHSTLANGDTNEPSLKITTRADPLSGVISYFDVAKTCDFHSTVTLVVGGSTSITVITLWNKRYTPNVAFWRGATCAAARQRSTFRAAPLGV